MTKLKPCKKCNEYPMISWGTGIYLHVEHFCLSDQTYYSMQIDAWNKRS